MRVEGDQNLHITILCEAVREGGWIRGATPLSRRGIPLLQWSAVLPPSLPSRASLTHSFSLSVSLPPSSSFSFLPPSLPNIHTPQSRFGWGGTVCCRVQYMQHMVRNASALVTRTFLLQPPFISIAPPPPLHLSSRSFSPSFHTSFPLSRGPSAHLLSPFFFVSPPFPSPCVTLIPRLLCCWLLLRC